MQVASTEKLTAPVCDVIEEKCKKYPHLQYERTSNSITVLPATQIGFPVSYSFDGNKHTISFLGWHEHFDDPKEAINCFAFGLSKKCRLQVWKKGKFQYKWIVESQNEDGSWQEDSTTGLLVFPFWMKTEIISLHNDLLE